MNQEEKAILAPKIKEVLKKYGMKGSISVYHYTHLVVTIKSGIIDFKEHYVPNLKTLIGQHYETDRIDNPQVNEFYIKEQRQDPAKSFLLELKEAMMIGNHDNSDIQSDYFDVGWYIDINIGQRDKPYILTNK